MSENVNTIE